MNLKIKSNGFTLLEIVICTAIFVLISTALSLIFNQSLIVYRVSTDKNKIAQGSSIAMDWLKRDISTATCIYAANSQSIVLRNPTSGYVKYYLQTPTTLVRNDCAVDYLLAEDVANLNFTSYDWQNQPTTLASKAEEIEITLTMASGNQNFTLNTVASPESCTSGCFLATSYGGLNTEQLYSSLQTSDAGFILGGLTSSFGPGGSGRNFLAIKAFSNGDVDWTKTYGGSATDELRALQQTSDGYVLGGYTASFGSAGDALVIKTSDTGVVTWAKSYGGSGLDVVDYLEGVSGGYILEGYTDSFGPVGSNRNLLVIKTNDTGTVTWAKAYGGGASDECRFLQQTSDGGYILAGITYSFGVGSADCLVIKTNDTGTVTWAKSYGGSGLDQLDCIQAVTGGYILGGYTNSFGSGGDFLLIKTDSSGNVGAAYPGTWAKTYGGTAADKLRFLNKTSDGGYILGGYTESFGPVGTSPRNFLLIKTDNTGTVTWAKTYGGSGYDDGIRFLNQTSDGGYILGGYTDSFTAGGQDFLVIKTDASGDITCCIPGFSVTSVVGQPGWNGGTSLTSGCPSSSTQICTTPLTSGCPSSSTQICTTPLTPLCPSSSTEICEASVIGQPGWNGGTDATVSVNSVCPKP